MAEEPNSEDRQDLDWSNIVRGAEKLSPLDEEAIRLHEAFQSLMRAGFSERQALLMLGVMAYDAMDTAYQIIIEDDGEDDDLGGPSHAQG